MEERVMEAYRIEDIAIATLQLEAANEYRSCEGLMHLRPAQKFNEQKIGTSHIAKYTRGLRYEGARQPERVM